MRRPSLVSIFSLCLIVPSWGYSNEIPATTGLSSASSASAEALSDWIVNYEAEYDGFAVTHPSRTTPDAFGMEGEPQNIEHKVFAGYRANDWLALGVTLQADHHPFTLPESEFLWSDPFLHAKAKRVINADAFSVNADLRAYLPATEKSRARDLKTAFRSGQNAAYRINSNWETGWKSMVRVNLFGPHPILDKKGRAPTRKDLTAFLKPYVSYRITPRLTAQLIYELNFSHLLGQRLGAWSTENQSLQPGLFWRITPGLDLRPYLAFQTQESLGLRSAYFGCDLKWDVL